MLLLSACGVDESEVTTLAATATSSHTGALPAVHMELKKLGSNGEAVGRPICKVYGTPAETRPEVNECPDGEYKEQLFGADWSQIGERDVVVGSTPGPGTLPAPTPGSWQTVSESQFGWLTFPGNRLGSRPNEGKAFGNPRARFSLAKAPDGSTAVQHTIKNGDEVHPLGADSPILLSKPYKRARLSYKIWTEDGKSRGRPGKYMSLMGGRGQAGGSYENGPQTGEKSANAEGWSYYLLSPVTSDKNKPEIAKNGHRGAIGSANRSELGSKCDENKSPPGGDPVNGDDKRCFEYLHAKSDTTATGRWVEVVMTIGMNTKGNKDGFAEYSLDGDTIGEQKGIMWAFDPDQTLDLWVRWRMMYGGTTESVPAKQNVKEWYKDFALEVVY